MSEPRASGHGRLLTGLAWAALLLALWLWGREATEVPATTWPATGDVAAAGRPPVRELPPPHAPLPGAQPERLAVRAMGLSAPIEGHGLTPQGAVEPPAYDRAGTVAWYRGGPQPGSLGAAVLVGHVDTERSPAVFYDLAGLQRGETVTVTRVDGSTADFTVEDVTVFTKDRFDAAKVYGPRDATRAELRLITCGGDYDRTRREYSANVVVSAYLTGSGRA
ncbi:class F sortase [Streptomyces sp. I05A-00742]|uniref:class F sortase n=1 Tax=Streptomyces sp. I05A-00742 TaxID=2732853 RepID=UPI0014883013|nr:class F sortase [Streptomyces sp. I05A-00742]